MWTIQADARLEPSHGTAATQARARGVPSTDTIIVLSLPVVLAVAVQRWCYDCRDHDVTARSWMFHDDVWPSTESDEGERTAT